MEQQNKLEAIDYTPVTLESLENAVGWMNEKHLRPVAVLTADQHLRMSQYGTTERSEDFLQAALYRASVARRLGVPILDAGDLLDTKKIEASVGDQMAQLNEALGDSRLYGTSGNHEASRPHWLETAARMLGDRCRLQFLDNRTIELPGGERVHGLPYMTKAGWEEIRKKVELMDIDILVVHAAVSEFCVDVGGSKLTVQDFLGTRAKIIHLGYIHVCRYLITEGGKIIGYPGSNELGSQREELEKWVVIVARQGPEWVLVRFRAPHRRVFALHIDSEDVLRTELERVSAARDEHPIVLVRYAPGMANVQGRFAAVLDPTKAYIRCAPDNTSRRALELGKVKTVENMEGGAGVDREGFPLVRVQDMVPNFIRPDHPFFRLALELCEPLADPARLIEVAVEKRKTELAEIEKASIALRQ